MENKLPICEVIPKLKEQIKAKNRIILEASAGAGKSTVVPISLLDEEFLEDKKILVLEPRRVATRAVAKRMAELLDESVGQTVGYQIKNESVISSKTKILVVTEAILTRKIQSNQSLDDIALVIFDEFHERSIHTDLGLALCLEVQELIREDLKLLIMSATLNSNSLEKILEPCSVIKSEGRVFPIEEIYLKENVKHPNIKELDELILETIIFSIQNDIGDILVFLAGLKEIKILQEKLSSKNFKDIEILSLHSSLTKEEQDKAIQKSSNRKIILSTNIAQTSLTIEGIKVVIDSGIEKTMIYSNKTHMNYLEYSFIAKDSAIQRAGRAGRLSSGKCYKLWHKNRILEDKSIPEILKTDLSAIFLELSQWGAKSFEELKFLDLPHKANVESSIKSLQDLEMIDEKLNLTKYGKEAISLGIHPRLSHMILKSIDLGYVYEACILASILLNNVKNIVECFFNTPNHIKYDANQIYKKLNLNKDYKKNSFTDNFIGVLLLFAYPNRLAKLREINDYKYKLSNSKVAILNKQSKLFNEEYIVAVDLNSKDDILYIQEAVKINYTDIEKYFSFHIKSQQKLNFDKTTLKLENKTIYKFLDLELYSSINEKLEEEEYKDLLIELLRGEGLDLLVFCKKSENLISRVNFLNSLKQDKINLTSFSKEDLIEELDIWLKPYLNSIHSIKKLQELDLYSILLSRLSWEEQQTLDKLAPIFIEVPSGSKIKIDYSNIEMPNLKVKIQEVFGLNQSPRIVNEQVILQIHLLSPANRAIQITNDLDSFWQNSYDEVKKELKGKYKKHYWPDNPYEAIATNKTKKFM